MDLSVPFFGNPNISRQGDKGRQNLKKEYEPSWLDSFLEGFFGGDAPAGSVLDPKTDKRQTAKDIGNAVGIATDLVGPAKALGLAALAAVPAIGASAISGGVKNLMGQSGAIRIGGAKDLMLSHAFYPGAGETIAKSGFLAAPSLGITSNKPSTFDRTRPELVFRAGAVNPEGHPSALLNRDGWFANPHGMVDSFSGRDIYNFPEIAKVWDSKTFREELKASLRDYKSAGHSKYAEDLRLGQFESPDDYNAKALAIALSPKFSTFKEFEKSMQGAQLLRENPQGMRQLWEESKDLAQKLADTYGNNPNKAILDRLASGEDPAKFPFHLQSLYHRQLNAPSDMAELKIFDKLDLNPADAFVYVGGGVQKADETTKGLQAFADKGYKLVDPFTAMKPSTLEAFDKHPNYLMRPDQFAASDVPRISNEKGTFSFPPQVGADPIDLNGFPSANHYAGVKGYRPQELAVMMKNARTGGGSPPLSMLGAPRISDEAAKAAQPLVKKYKEIPHVSLALKAAELLQPGVLQKYQNSGLDEDAISPLWGLSQLIAEGTGVGTMSSKLALEEATRDLLKGIPPLVGPKKPYVQPPKEYDPLKAWINFSPPK